MFKKFGKTGDESAPVSTIENTALPQTDVIREEYERVEYRRRFAGTVRSTTNVLIVVAAIAILVAVGMFRASGAMELLEEGIASLFALVGINTELAQAVPTALMKPLSGSGARGLMLEAMNNYGADSLSGRLCCILQGTTDTTFYVLAVYFGSVGIKNTRHAVACCLLADLAGIIAAFAIAPIFFG